MLTRRKHVNTSPLFFLHIPRTGGTTIDSILISQFAEDQVLKIYKQDEYVKNRFLFKQDLHKIKYITGHLLLQNYDPPTLYDLQVRAFTFLREPVSRLISEYIFYKTWPDQHIYHYIKEQNLSFRDYLLSDVTMLKYRGKNFMTRCISGKSFTYNKTSLSALAFAKRQLEKNFFFFGITELFNESIVLLSHKINIKNLFHEQRNKLNSSLKDKISDEDISLAKELNQSDTALYNFAKQLFLSRIEDLGNSFREKLNKFIFLNERFKNISKLINEKNESQNNEIYLPK